MPGIVPYTGDGLSRAQHWAHLPIDERRRRAMQACRDRDRAELWSLTEAFLTLHGTAGARLSDNTRDAYAGSVRALLDAWSGVNLLHPAPDDAALMVRQMEASGLSTSTIQVRLAGARALYKALRWAGAITTDPLADVRPAKDPTPASEKRKPYSDADVAALLVAAADPDDRLLILLLGHAGLRISEALALQHEDVDRVAGVLVVRHGKGGKRRSVPLSRALAEHFKTMTRNIPAVLPYRSDETARERLKTLCARAGVRYRGCHALRHWTGTKLYRQTGRLEDAQHMLGHAQISTTQVYAAWSDQRVRQSLRDW